MNKIDRDTQDYHLFLFSSHGHKGTTENLLSHVSGLCPNSFRSPLDKNTELSLPPSYKHTLTVSTMSWDCGLRYVFMPPVLQLGGVCALRDGGGSGGGGGMGTVCGREELTSRLGLEAVQRLAKDGCRLLQNHNYRLPDRNQAVSRKCD